MSSFPAFVRNRLSPLYRLSDANVHSRCVANDQHAQRADRMVRELSLRLGAGNRSCEVCGREVTSPDEYFTFGFLTDEPSSPAFSLNWLQFHLAHLPQWERLSESIEILDSLVAVEHWHTDDVGSLLSALRHADPSP